MKPLTNAEWMAEFFAIIWYYGGTLTLHVAHFLVVKVRARYVSRWSISQGRPA